MSGAASSRADRLLRRRRDVKGDGDGKGGPLPQPALHPDGAVHLFHQALDDGHPQAGALIDAAGIRVFLGEGVENMLQKLFTHTDARIADRPAVGNGLLVLFHHLEQRGDGAPHLVVLDAVGVNIQEYLPQVDGTSVDPEIRSLV